MTDSNIHHLRLKQALPPQLLLFDLDGTLIEYKSSIVAKAYDFLSTNTPMDVTGKPLPIPKEIETLLQKLPINLNASRLVNNLNYDLTELYCNWSASNNPTPWKNILISLKHELNATVSYKPVLRDGVLNILKTAKNNNIPCGIITSRENRPISLEYAKIQLRTLGMFDFFQHLFLVGNGTDPAYAKCDKIEELAQNQKIEKDRIWYTGDSSYDVKAGCLAGVITFGLEGTSAEEEIKDNDEGIIVSGMTGLDQKLKQKIKEHQLKSPGQQPVAQIR